MPRDSRYVEAIANDERIAEQLARQPEPEPGRRSPPRLADWSPELEALYALVDRVGELVAVTAHAKKPPKPLPRPVTALDRVRERQREERHQSLVARVQLAQRPAGS